MPANGQAPYQTRRKTTKSFSFQNFKLIFIDENNPTFGVLNGLFYTFSVDSHGSQPKKQAG